MSTKKTFITPTIAPTPYGFREINFNLDCDRSSLQALVKDLKQILAQSGLKPSKAWDKTIKGLTLNFIKYNSGKDHRIAISQSKAYYDGLGRYNTVGITLNMFKTVKGALESIDYVKFELGSPYKNRATTIYPKKCFRNFLDKYRIKPDDIFINPSAETIKLRKKITFEIDDFTTVEKKVYKAYDNNSIADTYRDNLKTINANLKNYDFKVPSKNLSPQQYYRVFNDDFSHGGRFYGAELLQLNEAERAKATINGKPTVELDFSGMHLNMVHHLEGMNLKNPKQPYSVSSQCNTFRNSHKSKNPHRYIIKKIVLVMFNSDDRAKTIHAVLKELKQDVKNGDLSSNVKFDKKSIELGMKLITKRYSKILPNFSSYFNTGMGTQLQFYDSSIAEAVLLHFSAHSKPCYSVHDSFIVLKDDKTLLEQVMLEKYQSIMWDCISSTSKSKLKNKSNINILIK